MQEQKIGKLIEEDLSNAYALYKSGLFFKDHSSISLSEACFHESIQRDWVEKNLNKIKNYDPLCTDSKSFELFELLDQLKMVHRFFYKEKLPFLHLLIHSSRPNEFFDPQMGLDLKLLFPLFYEDFVCHIKKEESQLFNYAIELDRVLSEGSNPAIVAYYKPKMDLVQLAHHHREEDDEMEGIRNLTNNYLLPPGASLTQKVVFFELKKFESDLRRHSAMENDHFFPLLIGLEGRFRKHIKPLIILN